jgi:regulator of sigma E protease
MAKWCGVKVLKFSIGFGKPLFFKKIGQDQTEFILAAIPLGGYVKMLDEREIEQETKEGLEHPVFTEKDLQRAFNRQSVFKRMAIVLAGPFANLLLAIFLYWLLFLTGVVGLKPIVGNVLERSPAALASMASGETIQKVSGKKVSTWQDVRWMLLNEALKKKSVEIQAVSHNQQIHLHVLDLSAIDFDDAQQDILTKVGLTIYQPDIPARIGEVAEGSAADIAGFQSGDLVLSANHSKVNVWEDFVREIRMNPNVNLNIVILRDTNEIKLTVKPEAMIENGKTIGRIGAAFLIDQKEANQYLVTTHYSAGVAMLKAIVKTWDTAIFSLKMLGNMVVGQVSWKGMSGPVTIASYAGQSANMGIKVFISFLALISISIGVLNLLPIPVLDGGHFMYHMVEFFTGKPVSENVMVIGQKIGFSLLGLMMVLALFNDINRLISG